jgi:hypothetical protein
MHMTNNNINNNKHRQDKTTTKTMHAPSPLLSPQATKPAVLAREARPAVQVIAQHGAPERSQMHTNLVRASCCFGGVGSGEGV